MKSNNIVRATLAVAIVGLATSALAQVSADKTGKSTSGTTPMATPVTPGAPGKPLTGANASDDGYTTYWTALDANNDGKVTREEYLAYYGTRWDKTDTAKRGYYDRQGLRTLYTERELSKTDGQPMGSPLNPTTKK